MGTWRKAYGALKDSTKVGLAKVNSEFKELDIAIVKATNHSERPPKERHIRKIFIATSISRPRGDVTYCIFQLSRRLSKTRNWIVALKTLIVIHRTLREGDPTFCEELLNYVVKRNILQIPNFRDDSSARAWDCSIWVRAYALYLEERLECFRILRFDMHADRLIKLPGEAGKGQNGTRSLSCPDLLEKLPALQQLLFHLIGCQPEGASRGNLLIQYALALVLKESFKVYCAINDGIINLVDMFFGMSKYDAIKALDIYKVAGQQAEDLSSFYDFCKRLELARNFQFPTLKQAPPSFLATMEDYIREAPAVASISHEKNKPTEIEEQDKMQPVAESEQQLEDSERTPEAVFQPADIVDLLSFDEIDPAADNHDLQNVLALAIISPEDDSKSLTTQDLFGANSSGWELALVSSPPSNKNDFVESKLAGGLDRLMLESLYDDSERRQQMAAVQGAGVVANPFEAIIPFAVPNVQMSWTAQYQQQQQQYYQQMLQQQQYFQQQKYYQQQLVQQQQNQPQQQYYQQQQMMMMPYQPQQQPLNSVNPFGDPFESLSFGPSSRGN